MCLFSRAPPNFFTLKYTASKKHIATNPHITEMIPANCKSTFNKAMEIERK